jgi:hypothetical protein
LQGADREVDRTVKFVDHVDHVVWITYPDKIDAAAAELGTLCNVKMEGPWVRDDIGLTICVSWEAGLELVAPHSERTDFNGPLHDHLAERGEGMYAIVFGVRDIQAAAERARFLGYSPGAFMTEGTDTPWAGKHDKLLESHVTKFLNTWILYGQIDYPDGVVRID